MSLTPDLRHAFRHLRQSPGYAATAILTFALAIGANSAIFSAVNTVLLRPLPVQDPDNLAVVWQTDAGGQAVVELTYRHLREWSAAGTTFTRAGVMGSHNWSAVLQGRGEPTRVWFCGVSAGFFEALGVAPLLGRTLRAEDDVPNAPAVAVLNHGAWVRRFGSDPAIVGTRMTLDGSQVEIVGVMPPGVDVPQGAEFWVPVVPILATGTPPNTSALDTLGVFYVVGRMRPDLTVQSLRAEIDATEARLDQADGGRLKWGTAAVVTPFLEYVFGPVRPALHVLWAAVGVLLLIACANVSGLMLTRVSRRRYDHGIRIALGATRGAIARLWINEILIVAVAGGILGLAVAHWIARAVVALAPDDLPRVADISVDLTVAIFTFVVVVAAALVTGAAPLRHAGAVNLLETLEGERTTSGRRTLRARSTLLVVQIALSIVLLVSAGLVLRSFLALRHVDLGFTPDRVLTLTVQPQTTSRPPNLWLHDFLTRVRALPGVETAGAVYLRPLILGPIGQGVRVYLEGQPETRQTAEANPTLNHQIATPGYVETLRIPLRAGRLFTDRDTAQSPRVAIVGESTARRLWPGQDPIGKRLSMATFTPGGPPRAWRTVVGVVSDVRYRGLREVQLDVYDPALQVGRPADNIVVRTSGDPLTAAAGVRAIARELDPASIVDSVTTMEAVVVRAEAPWRLTTWMFVLFAALAFALAALGLFSLVAQDVAHRRREFAIRLALGASPAAILRGVLLRAGWRVVGGVAAGLVVSFLAGRTLRGLLFGIAPGDRGTYAMVLALVLVVVALAAYLPARRAADVNPQGLMRDS
jgi:putative ABC transport system permease protein